MTPPRDNSDIWVLERILEWVLIPLLVVGVIALYVVLALRIAGVIHGCAQ